MQSMTKSVFISRDQDEFSEFSTLLHAAAWQVSGSSLVALTPLPVEAVPEADWIFFASKNAVRFFFEGIGWMVEDTNPVFASILWAALGPATARELLRYTHRVDFTGSGDPAGTATAFLPIARGKRVLFPAARHSQQSIARLLGDAITALHLAVYDNAPLADPPRLGESILVFTSPMNARAYFARHSLQTHQRVVAIGQTTASALKVLGIKNAVMPKEPTEAALADTVLAMMAG